MAEEPDCARVEAPAVNDGEDSSDELQMSEEHAGESRELWPLKNCRNKPKEPSGRLLQGPLPH